MNNLKNFILMVLSIALFTSSAVNAQQKEKKSKLGKPTLPKLAYVNLDAELGLKNEMLRGFGLRVDEAVRNADAATVAALAVMLGFAEEVAGKTGKTITSVALLKHASRIAEEKQNNKSADAVILAAQKIKGGDAVAKSMKEAQKLFVTKRGAGNFVAYVKIINKSDRVLDIYVDGNYVGYLYGDESNTYSTGNGTTNARVNDAFGNTTSEIFYLETEETFTWIIQP